MSTATIDAHGYVIIMHLLNLAGVMFAYRRGVMVARSGGLGNPRASRCGASNGRVSTLFLYLGVRALINHLATLLGDVVRKSKAMSNQVV